MAPNKKKFLRSLTFDLIPIKPHLTHGTKVWSANPKMENPQIHFSRSHRSTRLVRWCTGWTLTSPLVQVHRRQHLLHLHFLQRFPPCSCQARHGRQKQGLFTLLLFCTLLPSHQSAERFHFHMHIANIPVVFLFISHPGSKSSKLVNWQISKTGAKKEVN